jgi:hypothetical protein
MVRSPLFYLTMIPMMNSFLKMLLFLLISSFTISCSVKETMDPWETEMAGELQAENVQLSHFAGRIVNGESSHDENYLQLNILNSEVMGPIVFDKDMFAEKCGEIRHAILALPEINKFPAFNELRLNIIKKGGVLLKTEETFTMSYKMR